MANPDGLPAAGDAAPSALPSVSIVIPAYNEADQLAESLTVLHDSLHDLAARYDWQILVVDDGSRDGTGSIAEEFAHTHHRVTVLRHQRNQGLGGALRTAFRATTSQYLVVMDSDLSYSPAHIRPLLDKIVQTGAAVVVASPYRRDAEATGVPLGRLIASKSVNRVLAIADGRGISTFTGMVRAYDARFVRSIPLHSSDPTINSEILYRARLEDALVVEIPARLDWTRLPIHRQGRVSWRKLVRTGCSTLTFACRLLLLRARPTMNQT